MPAGPLPEPCDRATRAGPGSDSPSRNRPRSSASAAADGVPLIRLLRQALQADRLQVAGQLRAAGATAGTGSSCSTCRTVSMTVAAAERRAAGQQLVQDGPEGVDVAPPGRPRCPVAGGLLRGHVARRAHDRPRSRSGAVPRACCLARPKSVILSRQAVAVPRPDCDCRCRCRCSLKQDVAGFRSRWTTPRSWA